MTEMLCRTLCNISLIMSSATSASQDLHVSDLMFLRLSSDIKIGFHGFSMASPNNNIGLRPTYACHNADIPTFNECAEISRVKTHN